MKEKIFDLQRFADESTDQGTTEPEGAGQVSDEKGAPESDKKYSDADLDRIIGQKFAKWAKQKEADIAKAKAESAMSTEQKAQAKQAELENQVAQLLVAQMRVQQEKEAAKALKDKGIIADEQLISMVIGEDSESTAAKVSAMVKVLETQRQAVEKKFATGKTPASTSSAHEQLDPLQKKINAWKK